MKKRLRFSQLALLLGLFLPSSAYAHVKWFATDGVSIEPFSLTESAVIIWISIIGVTALLAFFIDKRFPGRGRNRKRWSAGLVRFFHAGIGLWLLLAGLQNHLFAPVFEADSPLLTAVRIAMIIIGIAYILGMGTQIASLALLISYGITVWVFGPLEMIEHLFIPGIALTSLIITSTPSNFLYRYSYWSVPLLRITLGIALVALAFNEKLFHPDLAAAFLQEHNWNFMELLGFNWYTDRLFILSAGMTELLLGLFIIAGLVTRLTVIAIVVVFSMTAILLGPQEVLGHLPIIVILVVLFRYNGGRFSITRLFSKKYNRSNRSETFDEE